MCHLFYHFGLTWMVVGVAFGSRGYLPTVGPVPIRFQAVLEPAAKIVLPVEAEPSSEAASNPVSVAPLLQNQAAATNAPSVERPSTASPTFVLTNPTPVLDFGGATLIPPKAGIFPENNAPGVITPQMLIPFILSKNNSNSTPGFILATNVNFLPPMPGSPASSTATYLSPPAAQGP